MATFVRHEAYSEHLAEKVHDLNADTIKIYLTNATPDVSLDVVKADLAEIAAGNGYTAGGVDIQNATSRTGAQTSVTGVDATITAAGGAIGPFRYGVMYNDTPATPADPIIGHYDYGSSISLNAGESLLLDVQAALLTIG